MKKRRKTLTILGAIVASSLLSMGCNKSNADQRDQNYANGNGGTVGRCPSSSYAQGRYNGNGPAYGDSSSYESGYVRSPRDRAYSDAPASRYGDDRHGIGIPYGDKKGYEKGYTKERRYEKTNGYGTNGNGMKKHNPLNVERVKGEITDKKMIRNPDGSSTVMIKLQTKDEEMKVILGPSAYLDGSRVALQIGDTVEVKGSRMQVNGDEMMIASEISKNGNMIPLRDDQGRAMWQQYQGPMPRDSYGYGMRRGSSYGYGDPYQYGASYRYGNNWGYRSR